MDLAMKRVVRDVSLFVLLLFVFAVLVEQQLKIASSNSGIPFHVKEKRKNPRINTRGFD
jgi:hypothetical protein